MTRLSFMSNFSIEYVITLCWFALVCEEIMSLSRKQTFCVYTFGLWMEIKSIIKNGVSNAIIEGSIYRSTIVSITNHLPYFKELNAVVLFIIDFLFAPSSEYNHNPDFGYQLLKLVIKTILGYYLVSMNNIVRSIAFHAMFTVSVSLVVYGYKKLLWKGPSLFGEMKFEIGKSIIGIDNVSNRYAQAPKLKRSNSLSDLREYKFQPFPTPSENDTIIPKDKINDDTLESIDKFDKLVRDKEMKSMKKNNRSSMYMA